jgi:(+)-pinoresinol hydroxylase
MIGTRGLSREPSRGLSPPGTVPLATIAAGGRSYRYPRVSLCMLVVLTCGWQARAPAQETPFPVAAWSRTAAFDETSGSPAERGRAVFNNWCDACHRRSEMNAPGTRSLQFKYRGELPAALEDREDLTPALIELYVRNGIATMPFFRKTEVSDADLEALSEYLSR